MTMLLSQFLRKRKAVADSISLDAFNAALGDAYYQDLRVINDVRGQTNGLLMDGDKIVAFLPNIKTLTVGELQRQAAAYLMERIK